MWGIVGIASKNDCVKGIITGLYSLEYRGYDSSGAGVLGDTEKLRKITNKVYSIKSQSDQKLDLGYTSLNYPELDSIIIMSKFYPWIIKYSMYKGLDPDTPRYLTKVTQTY